MESILFAEWLAENHYKMINKTIDDTFWQNEDGIRSIKALYRIFKDRPLNVKA